MKLKIKHRLLIVNLGLLVFLAFIYYLYSSLSGSFQVITDSSNQTIAQAYDLNELILKSNDYIDNKISKDELRSMISNQANKLNQPLKTEVLQLNAIIENISNKKEKNQELAKQVQDLTQNSIKQSNDYISQVSERLADPNKREQVSTLERLVIQGASANTNNNYEIAQLFQELRINLDNKTKLLSTIKTSIKNAEADKERLKNTPFKQLPEIALNANKAILKYSTEYIANQEQIELFSLNLQNAIANATVNISENTHKALEQSSNENRTYIVSAVFMLLAIIAIILIFNIQLNLLIKNQLGGEPKEISEIAHAISSGNLNYLFDSQRPKQSAYQAMSRMAESLKQTVFEIQNTIIELSDSSGQLSSTANEQAASAEEVSSSMEQMMANIEQNADNAMQTETIAQRANSEISSGYQNVQQTVSTMKEIVENISIIEELAEKTDLLAINAAIEAARAGEHGKGFAVVAVEVRKLAERSQKAAADINIISKSSMEIAEKTGESMAGVVPEIEKTLHLVQEISSASKEQNSGVNQVNSAIQQLNTSNQSTAINAERLTQQATKLKEIIGFFKTSRNDNNSLFDRKTTVQTSSKVSSKIKESVSNETYSSF